MNKTWNIFGYTIIITNVQCKSELERMLESSNNAIDKIVKDFSNIMDEMRGELDD